MLAKLTAKNQLTLPKSVLATCEQATCFDVTSENGRIMLTPVRINRADAVRAKLAELGITEKDAAEADWLVTGDKDLLDLASAFSVPIVTPASLLEILGANHTYTPQ